MDTTQTQSEPTSLSPFPAGSEVVYGMHGRCSVTSIEERTVNGEKISFYKLQPLKPPLSRSKKLDPAIWLPVNNARKQGLRAVMSKDDAERIYTVFSNKEYYFSLEEPWSTVFPKLEKCISEDGALGFAKVESYLYVMKKRFVVLAPEVNRFAEMIRLVFMRELSEITGETIRSLEERMEKSMKAKLSPDN